MSSSQRWSKDNAGLTAPTLTWVNQMLKTTEPVEVQISQLIGQGSHAVILSWARQLKGKSDEAAKVCGGLPTLGGVRWDKNQGAQVNSVDTLMPLAEETLLMADGQAVDRAQKSVAAAFTNQKRRPHVSSSWHIFGFWRSMSNTPPSCVLEPQSELWVNLQTWARRTSKMYTYTPGSRIFFHTPRTIPHCFVAPPSFIQCRLHCMFFHFAFEFNHL